MTRLVFLFLAALIACGPSVLEVVPELPGDGTENFEKRSAPVAEDSADDPWADAELITMPQPRQPQPIELGPVERFRLKNGLEVIAVHDESLPVFSMQLAVRAGTRHEDKGKVGLARFVGNMLTRGTRRRTAVKIAQAIDGAGGVLTANAGFEATLVQCKVLSKAQKTCVDLVSDVVTNPSFPQSEFELARRELEQVMRSRRDDAGQLASAHFQTFLWGEGHVRGWPMSEATIGNIEREDILKWHKKWFRPNASVLAVAGNFATESLKTELERSFGRWRQAEVPEEKTYDPPKIKGLKLLLVDKPDQTQSHIRVGHIGIAHTDPAFYSTLVMNYVLGGGAFSSRLLTTVRSKEGKTYTASSSFDRNRDVGAFVASTFTRTAETVATVQLLRDEISRMAAEGPNVNEVSGAITNLAGSYALRFETAHDTAGAILAAELHGLSSEYVSGFPARVSAVTVADARQAAQKILKPQDLVIVIVGRAAEIEPQLKSAGWVYEKVGHLEPIAPWERDSPSEEIEQTPETLAEAGKIMEAALKTKGGDAAASIKSFSWKGAAELTVPTGTMPARVQKRFSGPDKLRLDMQIGGGDVEIVTVLSGNAAFTREKSARGENTVDLPPAELAALKTQLWRDAELVLSRHRDPGTKLELIGTRRFSGRPHHEIRMTRKDGTAQVVLLIDKKTNHLSGLEYEEQGIKATETLGDYRRVGKILVAHSRRTKSRQVDLSIKLDQVQINQKVAPLLFVKSPAPAGKKSPRPPAKKKKDSQ